MILRAGGFTIVLVLLLCIGGCQSLWSDESARPSAQGTPEAVRIKALLLEQPDLAGSAIDVEFDAGRVTLTGFVETTEQRRQAEAVAAGQDDVDEVDNRIEVK